MEEWQILKKLSAIPSEVWKAVCSKCYSHISLRLAGKTTTGAHCEQRLGMQAADFYFGQAVKAIYGGSWKWQYDKFSIDEQMIRIIDSMISEEVRKYKVERNRGQKTVFVENEELAQQIGYVEEDEDEDKNYLMKVAQALVIACENNEKYTLFVHLKHKGFNYIDICKEMNCTRIEAYQMMENISRSARKVLKSL